MGLFSKYAKPGYSPGDSPSDKPENPLFTEGYEPYNNPGIPGPDQFLDATGSSPYRLPPAMPGPDIDAGVGGGFGGLVTSSRNIVTTGGGDISFYNVGLACFRAFHYGERPLPGRRYPGYIPPRGFSEWLR